MAGQLTGLQMSYIFRGTEIALYTAVVYGDNDQECKIPEADNTGLPLGVVCNDERLNDPLRAGGSQDGRQVAVQLDRIASVKAGGTIGYGKKVIIGAGGVIKEMPAVAGTYNVLGVCEKAGVKDDVLPVRICCQQVTVA